MSLERKSLIDRTWLDGWPARNNDTHQNNTAEQAGPALRGCIIMNTHLLCPKLTVPKGLRNTTESLKLLIHANGRDYFFSLGRRVARVCLWAASNFHWTLNPNKIHLIRSHTAKDGCICVCAFHLPPNINGLPMTTFKRAFAGFLTKCVCNSRPFRHCVITGIQQKCPPPTTRHPWKAQPQFIALWQ